MSLVDHARNFLKASSYDVETKDQNLLIASKLGLGGDKEHRCVWVLSGEERQRKQQSLLEQEYIGRFLGIQRSEKYGGAGLHLLADSLEGLSKDFLAEARGQLRVKVHVPAQFFDANFKYEVISHETASAIQDLVHRAPPDSQRVPQPYTQKEGGGGDDLLGHLLDEIHTARNGQDPIVWIIAAPAGYGKSVLFSSLFGKLYRTFQDHKKRQSLYPRPMPMLPAHVRRATGHNVNGLIDAFLSTEIANPTKRSLFDWLVDSRHALWMLDGLDEMITRDELFFEYLEDRITAPRSRPAILICVRDSLLETSSDLVDFLDEYDAVVKTYHLNRWSTSEKRRFAWIRLEDRVPKSGEKESDQVTRFLSSIRRGPTLKELSRTPFYADLLIEEYRDGRNIDGVGDRVGLLDRALSRMCEREYDKGTVHKDVLPLKELIGWLEEAAAMSMSSGDGGISADDLREWASVVPALVERDLSDEEQQRLVGQIEMLPFFQSSPVTHKIEFTHEILAELLAARSFVSELRKDVAQFARYVSVRQWPADSVIFDILSRADSLRTLVAMYGSESLRPIARRNVVQMIARSHDRARPFQQHGISLEGVPLEGVVFEELDMTGVSFRSCNLTNAVFDKCILENARFEGAVWKNTTFASVPGGGLAGASFGRCERFESAVVDGKRVTDDAKFRTWLAEATGHDTELGGCAARRQVEHVVRKFIHVSGQPRRDELDRRGVVRGKQYAGAPDSDECVDIMLRLGYLEVSRGPRKRIRRPDGAKYGELVAFVKETETSRGLVALLSSLCSRPACSHV